jgi:hypothetical protein
MAMKCSCGLGDADTRYIVRVHFKPGQEPGYTNTQPSRCDFYPNPPTRGGEIKWGSLACNFWFWAPGVPKSHLEAAQVAARSLRSRLRGRAAKVEIVEDGSRRSW